MADAEVEIKTFALAFGAVEHYFTALDLKL